MSRAHQAATAESGRLPKTGAKNGQGTFLNLQVMFSTGVKRIRKAKGKEGGGS